MAGLTPVGPDPSSWRLPPARNALLTNSSPPVSLFLSREVSKHTPELAQLLVNAGGVSAIIDYLGESSGTIRLPGIMTLGYVAAHSENLAMTVIVSKGVAQLAICLGGDSFHFSCSLTRMRSLRTWILGTLGY